MLNNLDTLNSMKRGLGRLDDHAKARVGAQQLFDQFMKAGRRQRRMAALLRRPTRIQALTGMEHARPRQAGLRTVQIDTIHGTENRGDEFDVNFYPVKEHIENRWVNVAIAFLRGVALPPVKLIESNGEYYVRDGHHRISVARALGQDSIDAEIIVLER